jgi:hypothetical protein
MTKDLDFSHAVYARASYERLVSHSETSRLDHKDVVKNNLTGAQQDKIIYVK